MKSKRLEIYQDHRGSLYEAFELDEGQVFIITIKPGKIRGNHYHLRKTEQFLVVFGDAEIACRDRETGEVTRYQVEAQDPQTITVTPGNTHNISSKDGCMLVCWVSEKLDEADPDTYAEEV